MPAEPPREPPADRYDHRLTVLDADIDINGHVNNVVYLRWVQESAVAHWFAAVEPALATSVYWAVVRHEIDYKRPAHAGDELTARTWVGEMSGATCERFCDVIRQSDGRILARSRTLWCVFDPKTARPMRIDPRLRDCFHGRWPLNPESPRVQ